jgi:hypothetical protein
MDKFEVGSKVHVDTDNEEWEVRICEDGEVKRVWKNNLLIYLPNFEGGTTIVAPKVDCYVK